GLSINDNFKDKKNTRKSPVRINILGFVPMAQKSCSGSPIMGSAIQIYLLHMLGYVLRVHLHQLGRKRYLLSFWNLLSEESRAFFLLQIAYEYLPTFYLQPIILSFAHSGLQ